MSRNNLNKAITPKITSVPKISELNTPNSAVIESIKSTKSVAPSKNSNKEIDSSILNNMQQIKDKGVDVLRPEILFASEFIPIIKSQESEPGLQIQNGTKTISVNQVFKLIELHQSVQKALNDLTLEFIEKQINIDVNYVYEEIKQNYSSSIVKNTYQETFDAFVSELESNLIKEEPNSSRSNGIIKQQTNSTRY